MKPERRNAKLEADGIPTDAVLAVFGGRGRDVMSEERKQENLDNQERARSLARRLDKLERDIREFQCQPFNGISEFSSLYEVMDWMLPYDTEPLTVIAESMRERANVIGQILQNHGRADLTIDLFVAWVFESDWQRDKPFNSWGTLAGLFGWDLKKLKRRVVAIRKIRDSQKKDGDPSWPWQQKF